MSGSPTLDMRRLQRPPSPLGYPPLTVMTRLQVAAALGVSDDTVERSGIPCSRALGDRSPRYVWADVVEWIRKGIAA